MLRIRLRRTGKKKQASYRVVVADQRAPRDGAFVEVIGHYNPRTSPSTLVLEEERVRYWLSQGAQPSETVHRLLHGEGLIDVALPQRHTTPSTAEPSEAAAAGEAPEASPAAAETAPSAEAAPSADAESADTESTDEPPSDDTDDTDSGDGAPPEAEQETS